MDDAHVERKHPGRGLVKQEPVNPVLDEAIAIRPLSRRWRRRAFELDSEANIPLVEGDSP